MNLVDQIIQQESGGNPNAKNSRSSAAGAGQFIDGTWMSMLAKHRPDITGSRQELLALKSDPQLSREMTARYADDNGQILSKAGLPVTAGSSYLAHFAGPQGAVSLMQAQPGTPAAAILGDRAVAANPFLRGKSAGDVVAWADKIMGKGGGQPVALAVQQPAQPAQQVSPTMQQPEQPPPQPMAAPQAPRPQYTDQQITPAQFQPLKDPQYEQLLAQILGTSQPRSGGVFS